MIWYLFQRLTFYAFLGSLLLFFFLLGCGTDDSEPNRNSSEAPNNPDIIVVDPVDELPKPNPAYISKSFAGDVFLLDTTPIQINHVEVGFDSVVRSAILQPYIEQIKEDFDLPDEFFQGLSYFFPSTDWWNYFVKTNSIAAVGLCFCEVSTITFSYSFWESIPERDRYALVLHELGHMMGFDHDETPMPGYVFQMPNSIPEGTFSDYTPRASFMSVHMHTSVEFADDEIWSRLKADMHAKISNWKQNKKDTSLSLLTKVGSMQYERE